MPLLWTGFWAEEFSLVSLGIAPSQVSRAKSKHLRDSINSLAMPTGKDALGYPWARTPSTTWTSGHFAPRARRARLCPRPTSSMCGTISASRLARWTSTRAPGRCDITTTTLPLPTVAREATISNVLILPLKHRYGHHIMFPRAITYMGFYRFHEGKLSAFAGVSEVIRA